MKLPSELKPEQISPVIDTREQMPWDLAPMKAVSGTLQVGDYSVLGLESHIAIERKSLADFVCCCGTERERFRRELERGFRGWPVSAVIIESTWRAIEMGQWRSLLTPRQVQASLTSWIAQGHTIILGHDHQTAAMIARDLLFLRRDTDGGKLRRLRMESSNGRKLRRHRRAN